MSTQQAELDEYDGPDRPARGGYRESDRPDCGVTPYDDTPCKNPAIPTLGVCHVHVEHPSDDESNTDSADTPVRAAISPLEEQTLSP